MTQQNQIALNTQEKSIRDIKQNILSLMASQPPKIQSLIRQLIDYYQKLILCMPGNVYWMDKNNCSVGCNQNVLDLFGLKHIDDFDNLSFEDMAQLGQWSKDQGNSFQQDTQSVLNSGIPKTNVEEPPIPNPNGTDTYFLSSRMPLFNELGNVIGVVGISTDITQQKLTEIALNKANKAKNEFLANLSHDIRTPLSSVISLCEHLHNTIETENLKEIAFDAQSCAEQVLLLLDEILEITEIDSDNIPATKVKFSLSEFIHSVKVLMGNFAKQKQLSFICEIEAGTPNIVIGKRQLIHRVLLNLISNAIKFTEKGYIKIKFSGENISEKQFDLNIRVEDSGIGILKDNFEKIFDQFERGSSAFENIYEGRGLGLYIVKKFLNLLEGNIEVNSEPKKGSVFTVRIPLKVLHNNQFKDSQATPEIFQLTSSNKNSTYIPNELSGETKILLVEDTEIARKAVLNILSNFDYEILIAKTGTEAIKFAKNNQFDMILLDIGLPDISGIEVAKTIRQFELQNNIVPTPIIGLTAHVPQSSVQHCINAGIQQVIRKPLTLERANALFSNWLSHTIKSESKNYKVDNEKQFQAHLLEKFKQDLHINKKSLAVAYHSNSKENLKDIVHKLHGSARILKLTELNKICNSLEAAITDDFSDEEIEALYVDLMTIINNLIACKNFEAMS